MNINRYNYEAYFMLYIDNELSAAERKCVEDFAETHADLAKELALLQQTVLPPHTNFTFNGKEALLQPEHSSCQIDNTNYESYFVLYADDELNNLEKEAVELFVYKHPQHQSEFELLQKVKCSPDLNIQFANPSILFRYEKNEKPVVLFWWRYAAAALLLLIAGLWWLNENKKTVTDTNPVAVLKPAITNQLPTADTNPTLSSEKENDEKLVPIVKPSNKRSQKMTQPLTNNSHPSNVFTKKKNNTPIIKNGEPTNTVTKNLLASTITPQNGEVQNNPIATNTISVNSKEPAIDQPMKIATTVPEEVSYAVVNTQQSDENIYIGNTSLSKKNGLRGFIRKASRVIEKTTHINNRDNSGKGILIGNFEIALR